MTHFMKHILRLLQLGILFIAVPGINTLFAQESDAAKLAGEWLFEKAVIEEYSSDAARKLISSETVSSKEEIEAAASKWASVALKFNIGSQLNYVYDNENNAELYGDEGFYSQTVSSLLNFGYITEGNRLKVFMKNLIKPGLYEWQPSANYTFKISGNKLTLESVYYSNNKKGDTRRYVLKSTYVKQAGN